METNPREFIRKLREAKEKEVNFVLVRTINSSGSADSSGLEIKELNDIDMHEPTKQANGDIWFDDTESNRVHIFSPRSTLEIRPLGEKII